MNKRDICFFLFFFLYPYLSLNHGPFWKGFFSTYGMKQGTEASDGLKIPRFCGSTFFWCCGSYRGEGGFFLGHMLTSSGVVRELEVCVFFLLRLIKKNSSQTKTAGFLYHLDLTWQFFSNFFCLIGVIFVAAGLMAPVGYFVRYFVGG